MRRPGSALHAMQSIKACLPAMQLADRQAPARVMQRLDYFDVVPVVLPAPSFFVMVLLVSF
jgi:hypothetical protein